MPGDSRGIPVVSHVMSDVSYVMPSDSHVMPSGSRGICLFCHSGRFWFVILSGGLCPESKDLKAAGCQREEKPLMLTKNAFASFSSLCHGLYVVSVPLVMSVVSHVIPDVSHVIPDF